MDNGYTNTLDDLLSITKDQAYSAVNSISKTILCKVTKTDGFYVDVVELNYKNEVDDGSNELKNIPILQSPYFSQCININDVGILVNIQVDLSNFINETIYTSDLSNNYYVFVPILQKKAFKSSEKDFLLQSSGLKTNITLNDTYAALRTDGDLIEQAKGKYDLSCKSIKIEATGSDPLVIKNSVGGLKEVMDNLFQCMDGLASGMTGSTTNPSAYQGIKATAQQMINKIIG